MLQLLTEPLIERGYDVLRYNSRGVGKSTGWASFTGSREAEDLKELVQWAQSTMHLTSLVFVVCHVLRMPKMLPTHTTVVRATRMAHSSHQCTLS